MTTLQTHAVKTNTNLVPRALLICARWRNYSAAFGPAIFIIPSFRAFPCHLPGGEVKHHTTPNMITEIRICVQHQLTMRKN